jgi:putative intracellular protease/amidase
MNSRALVVVTSHDRLGDSGRSTGYWYEELAAPLAAFAAVGADVDVASITGGLPPVDPTSLPQRERDGSAPALVSTTIAIDRVDPEGYGAVFLVGGHGTMWDFPESEALAEVVSHVAVTGLVGAVCHGSAGLLGATERGGQPLVRDRRIVAFTDAEEVAAGADGAVPFSLHQRLAALGAKVGDGPVFTPQVARDDRLVTGQNPMSSRGAALLVADLLSESQR